MRRKDREVTDFAVVRSIIEACRVCRVAFCTDGAPYIVPLSLGVEWNGERPTLYFHCASEGRKLELLKQNPQVGFEMDCEWKLMEGPLACDYGCTFASIIGTGRIEIVASDEEKRRGLEAIMYQHTGRTHFDYSEEMLCAVTVLRLTVDEFSAKRRASF